MGQRHSRQAAGVGQWESPITSELITSKTLKLSLPYFDGDGDGSLYWLEGRPAEGGRTVVVRRWAACKGGGDTV